MILFVSSVSDKLGTLMAQDRKAGDSWGPALKYVLATLKKWHILQCLETTILDSIGLQVK